MTTRQILWSKKKGRVFIVSLIFTPGSASLSEVTALPQSWRWQRQCQVKGDSQRSFTHQHCHIQRLEWRLSFTSLVNSNWHLSTHTGSTDSHWFDFSNKFQKINTSYNHTDNFLMAEPFILTVMPVKNKQKFRQQTKLCFCRQYVQF